MPPICAARDDVEHVISDDPQIAGFSDQKYVFTDISYDVPDRVSMCGGISIGAYARSLCYIII